MSSTVTKVRNIIFALLLIILGGVIGFRFGTGKQVPLLSKALAVLPSTKLLNTKVPEKYENVDFTAFWNVWQRLEQQYVDPSKMDPRKMVDGAIAGMTASLGDPYTLYLPKEEQKRTQDDLNGEFEGVGMSLGYRNQAIAVLAPLKGLPAERAGIQAGDYVIRVKDEKKGIDKEVTGLTVPEVVSLIRGEKGTNVTITFLREQGQTFDKTLTRETIVVPSVELTFVEKDGKKVAHLKLSQFGGRTNEEWKEAVDTIIADKSVSGVILDVRNNPGGYLQEAVSIASEFIPDGVVVTQEGRYEKIPYYATKKGRLTTMPVAVLMNKGSASASEIVSGALRDRKKAPLIGENSFGKGSVQDAQELPDGSGLHVTVAKWLLPSGDWIHEKGLKPTIEVKVTPEEAKKNLEEKKDPQLDRAVEEVLKIK